MSSSNNRFNKGPQFRPMHSDPGLVEEEGSKKSQFKFPMTGRQSAIPGGQFETGRPAFPQFDLPIVSEQETSMFQFPDLEEQGTSAHGPVYPVTTGHNVPMFTQPTFEQSGPSAPGPSSPVATGHSVPPMVNGQGVPMLRLPVIGEQSNSAYGPTYPVTGNVPTMQPQTGVQRAPFPGVQPGIAPFQAAPVSQPYPVLQPMPMPGTQRLPYSQSYPSLPSAVVDKLDTPSYPQPVVDKKGASIPRQPLTPLPVHGGDPRLDKNMPFIAVVLNVLLVALVVWLTQNEIFTNFNGIGGNRISQSIVSTPLKRSLNDITNNKQISPLLFGTNMGLFQDNDEPMINSASTRQALKDIGVRVIRIPIRASLKDATIIAAAQSVKSIGAVPLAVIHGPESDGPIMSSDVHALKLLTSVFGNQPVYCEFGNESDIKGGSVATGIKAEQYVKIWNQTVPALKQQFPTARFLGPDNYQFTRRYLKTFLQHANPLPDGVDWHEYTCSVKWTAAFCLSLLDTWSVHFSQARAAMREAIGRELPIWITEWNYVSDQDNNTPINDGKYNNISFMTAWTNKAMQALIENRVYASLQYYATSASIPLVSNNQVGIEGQLFQQQYKKIMVDGVTPPMMSPQPPTPKPMLVPGQSFSFENGSTSGWMANGEDITQPVIATDRAFDGTQSIRFHMTNTSEDLFPYLAINADQVTTTPKAGQMLSGYLFVANKAAIVNAKIFVAGKNHGWNFAGDLTMNSGKWSRVWYSLPLNFDNNVTQIGIQFYTSTPGVATDVYLDDFSWS